MFVKLYDNLNELVHICECKDAKHAISMIKSDIEIFLKDKPLWNLSISHELSQAEKDASKRAFDAIQKM
tara:strand:+ start:162 stop:368 length:207 start_codon:yes stop_codon:yes gene_type:complete